MMTEHQCMTCNLYGEAEGESTKGKFGVAFVTINRTMTKGYPSTVCGVVWQVEGGTAMFSWTLRPKTVVDRQQWEIASKITDFVMYIRNTPDYYDLDFTRGSTHFHALTANPWPSLHQTEAIGRHRFYVDRRGLRNSSKSYCDLTAMAGLDYCPGGMKVSLEPPSVSLQGNNTDVCRKTRYLKNRISY
jgi:N-acetylmuramoyl-L-alanine amidase